MMIKELLLHCSWVVAFTENHHFDLSVCPCLYIVEYKKREGGYAFRTSGTTKDVCLCVDKRGIFDSDFQLKNYS